MGAVSQMGWSVAVEGEVGMEREVGVGRERRAESRGSGEGRIRRSAVGRKIERMSHE